MVYEGPGIWEIRGKVVPGRDVEGRPGPLMIVHGQNDNMLPIGQGEILFKNAKGPKTFFKVEKGGHNNPLAMNGGAYQKKVLARLDEVLK